ncbi:MAG: hypothetical protein MJE68_20085, partial [Proteobacteria bacterium]|nr:hypothetical protein [Pseudomonadota bacterium]
LQAYTTLKQGKAKQGKFLSNCALALAVITLVIGFLGHFVIWLMVALYIPYFTECGIFREGRRANTALCQNERNILF